MNTRILLAGTLLVVLAAPALADEYYVVQGPSHHCTITTEKPAAREVVTQIGPIAFTSREEAENRIKQTKICSEDTTGSGTVIKKEIDKD